MHLWAGVLFGLSTLTPLLSPIQLFLFTNPRSAKRQTRKPIPKAPRSGRPTCQFPWHRDARAAAGCPPHRKKPCSKISTKAPHSKFSKEINLKPAYNAGINLACQLVCAGTSQPVCSSSRVCIMLLNTSVFAFTRPSAASCSNSVIFTAAISPLLCL